MSIVSQFLYYITHLLVDRCP